MKRKKLITIGAITIIQPWAEIILFEGKNVENRQRNSHYRGTIAIHASSKNSKQWFDEAPIVVDRGAISFGAIIGLAELTSVITKSEVNRKTRKWFSGKYGYVLENVIALQSPVPMNGKRGLWTLISYESRACLSQLTDRQIMSLRRFAKL